MRLSDSQVRKTRVSSNEPGQLHELTFSCYQQLPLLNSDRTRQWFINALDDARKILHFEIWAYVIMPEHVHLLILPLDEHYKISSILKKIKQPVAQRAIHYLRKNHSSWLPRLQVTWPNGRTESRFWQQGGGYDRNIIKSKTAWSCVQYIHKNPLRRGLVKSEIDWQWSSARQYAGIEPVKLSVDNRPPDVM